MFSCSYVFQKKHVLLFSCLSKKTCPHVPMSFKQKHVLMFSCLSKKNMSSCSHVFQKKTCSSVLLSFQKNHVLMSQPVPIPKLNIPLYN